MNLSHVITEFSFGKHFPEITQPLDNSFEVTHDGASLSSVEDPHSNVPADFIAYQYYLRVVPTTYVAPRTEPLHTNQYSVTHYERTVNEHMGVPGIFFKFEIEPVRLTLIQRTTTIAQLFIRCVSLPSTAPPLSHICILTAVSALSVAYSSARPGVSAPRAGS